MIVSSTIEQSRSFRDLDAGWANLGQQSLGMLPGAVDVEFGNRAGHQRLMFEGSITYCTPPPFPPIFSSPDLSACNSTVEKAWHLVAGHVQGSIRSILLVSTRSASAEDTILGCNVFFFLSNCEMEANAGLGPTPTYMLVLFLHRFHRRACCLRSFFAMSRIRTSSRVNPEKRASPALLDAGTEL